MTEERLATLMVKTVDGVSTPAEKEELMAWLVDHPELAAELEDQLAAKALTDGWLERLRADLEPRRDPVSAGAGWMIAAGLALLICWGLVEAMMASDVPIIIRTGSALTLAGSLLLAGHLVRKRIGTQDPYDEVVR